MKKAYFLSAFIWCLLVCAACGKMEEDVVYYDIRVKNRILESVEGSQWLLGMQYYQGEPVRILGEQVSGQGAGITMDVYIQPAGKDKQLLMGGVPGEYRSGQWYLDGEGNCLIPWADGVIRLDVDGNMLYHSRVGGRVRDICGLGDGRVILLTEQNRKYGLAELDPVTGINTKIDSVSLGSGSQYIGASGNQLMLLDMEGFWHVDLKKGAKVLELPFGGTLYTFQNEETVSDFWIDGNKAGIIWASGVEEQMERVNVGEEREIIVVRGLNFTDLTNVRWLKEQVQLFNLSNDTYHAVLEEPGEGTGDSDFRTETNLKLASGKGADIIYGNALPGDIYSIIENGILADLTPLMAASGMSEEDYFPAAFDRWKHEGKIYGVCLNLLLRGYTMDKSLLGSGEELDIESFLDIMLDPDEKRFFYARWNERNILEDLLHGSEDLWGMVDWEKGSCDFGGELFTRMLRASKQCAYDERYDYPEILEWRPNFSFYTYETDNEMEKKGRIMAGVLFDDGCHAENLGNHVMGINAGSGHMEGAWQLLAFLLGEEAQSRVSYNSFPVNRKAFDRIAREEIEAEAFVEKISIIEGKEIKSAIGKKGDGEKLTQEAVDDMIRYLEDVKALPLRTQPLITIILEEAQEYFDGVKEIPQVVDAIENRVGLYLEERK